MKWLSLAVAVALALLSATAHAQVPGQPYQVPPGYESYEAGTVITYGGSNYVIQGDGTMLLDTGQEQVQETSAPYVILSTQPYLIPAGYEGYAVGTVIVYSGISYVITENGTMLMVDASQSASGGTESTGYTVVDNTLYQVPAGVIGVSVGSIIPYGGQFYLLRPGGMLRVNMWPHGYRPGPYPGPIHHGPHPGPIHPGPHPGPIHPGPHPGPIHPGPHPGPIHPGPHPGPIHPGPHPGPIHPGPHPGPIHPGPFVNRPGPIGRPGPMHPGPTGPGPTMNRGPVGHGPVMSRGPISNRGQMGPGHGTGQIRRR